MRKLIRIPLVLLAVVLGACSEDTGPQLYPVEAVEKVALDFARACIARDADAAAAKAAAPFRFRTRDWSTRQAMQQGLRTQIAALDEACRSADTCEVWPYAKLQQGAWPRGEQVTAEISERRLSALGLDPFGFLVRLASSTGTTVLLRVGPDASAKLAVTGCCLVLP